MKTNHMRLVRNYSINPIGGIECIVDSQGVKHCRITCPHCLSSRDVILPMYRTISSIQLLCVDCKEETT